jgi:DNA-directed RNA polymerase I and III subunit RPAC1
VWYRLLPQIELKEDIEGERAYRLQTCFSPGVIGIETTKKGALERIKAEDCFESFYMLRFNDSSKGSLLR